MAKNRPLTSGHSIEIKIETDGCHGQDQEVKYLEHIQLVISLDYSKRGNIYIELESPMGTVTPIMAERGHDTSSKGFQQWPLTSVHTWGEDPRGTWTLRVADRKNDTAEGSLNNVELILYGTKEKPFYHGKIGTDECLHLPQVPVNKVKSNYKKTSISKRTIVPQELKENPLDRLKNLFGNLNFN